MPELIPQAVNLLTVLIVGWAVATMFIVFADRLGELIRSFIKFEERG